YRDLWACGCGHRLQVISCDVIKVSELFHASTLQRLIQLLQGSKSSIRCCRLKFGQRARTGRNQVAIRRIFWHSSGYWSRVSVEMPRLTDRQPSSAVGCPG